MSKLKISTFLSIVAIAMFALAASSSQAQNVTHLRSFTQIISVTPGNTTASRTFPMATCPDVGSGYESFQLTDIVAMPVPVGSGMPVVNGKWSVFATVWQSWSTGSVTPFIGGTADGTNQVSVSLPGGRTLSDSNRVRVTLAQTHGGFVHISVTITGFCGDNRFLSAPPVS